jgi:hypothetical protein
VYADLAFPPMDYLVIIIVSECPRTKKSSELNFYAIN